MDINQLAMRANELCIKVTQETKADAWFSYSGHINAVCIAYYPDGYDNSSAIDKLVLCSCLVLRPENEKVFEQVIAILESLLCPTK